MPSNTEFIPCPICCLPTSTSTSTTYSPECSCPQPTLPPVDEMCNFHEQYTSCLQIGAQGDLCDGTCYWTWASVDWDCGTQGTPDGWVLVSDTCVSVTPAPTCSGSCTWMCDCSLPECYWLLVSNECFSPGGECSCSDPLVLYGMNCTIINDGDTEIGSCD